MSFKILEISQILSHIHTQRISNLLKEEKKGRNIIAGGLTVKYSTKQAHEKTGF